MTLERFERRARPKPSHIRGLNSLFEFNKTRQGLNLDQGVFEGKNKVRPIVRGQIQEVDSNPSKTLKSNPVYRWIRRDASQFEAIALRDQDVKKGLATIDDLVDRLSNNTLEEEEKRLNTLAVAEKTEEVAILAAPYVPRSQKKNPESQDDENGESSNKQKREKEKAPKPKSKGSSVSLSLDLKLPRIPQLDKLFESLSKFFAGFKNRLRTSNNGDLLHPLLTRFQEAGRERKWKLLPNSIELMRTNKELMRNLTPAGFIITKIMNKYDENTGELTVDAPRQVDIPLGYDSRYEIGTPLGRVDPAKVEVIGIPIPTDGNYRAVGARGFKYNLSEVALVTEKNKEIVGQRQIEIYVEKDELGNLVINLKGMPKDLQDEIKKANIVLKTKYTESYRYGHSIEQANWIDALPENERYRLNMYPPEIAKFVTTLLEKKKNKIRGFMDNDEIFARLAQFLGDYWLTYDLLDARINENEPIGFRQTERVLNGNLASCEGSNIALGQLMRYFLEEDEGIAYVEGFVAEGSSITSRNLHLKVLYKDQVGGKHLFDATPWAEEDHVMFNVLSRRRKLAAQEWYSKSRRLREGELLKLRDELPNRIGKVSERIRTSWQDTSDLPRTLTQRMQREHLYLSSMNADQPYENQLIAETIVWRKRWFKSDYHTIPKEIGYFFREQYNVERYGQLWRFPHGVIDGKIDFDIKFLKGKFYSESNETSFNLFKYLDQTATHPILSDLERQQRIFRLMTNVSEQALIASNQNVETLNLVAQQVENF